MEGRKKRRREGEMSSRNRKDCRVEGSTWENGDHNVKEMAGVANS